MQEIYVQIASRIIGQQEVIIGPVAVEQAKKVPGLSIHWDDHKIVISGDNVTVIDDLVHQYERLFGQLSVEVCKDAAAQLVAQLPPEKQPKTLR